MVRGRVGDVCATSYEPRGAEPIGALPHRRTAARRASVSVCGDDRIRSGDGLSRHPPGDRRASVARPTCFSPTSWAVLPAGSPNGLRPLRNSIRTRFRSSIRIPFRSSIRKRGTRSCRSAGSSGPATCGGRSRRFATPSSPGPRPSGPHGTTVPYPSPRATRRDSAVSSATPGGQCGHRAGPSDRTADGGAGDDQLYAAAVGVQHRRRRSGRADHRGRRSQHGDDADAGDHGTHAGAAGKQGQRDFQVVERRLRCRMRSRSRHHARPRGGQDTTAAARHLPAFRIHARGAHTPRRQDHSAPIMPSRRPNARRRSATSSCRIAAEHRPQMM